jgi:hypothetical protein
MKKNSSLCNFVFFSLIAASLASLSYADPPEGKGKGHGKSKAESHDEAANKGKDHGRDQDYVTTIMTIIAVVRWSPWTLASAMRAGWLGNTI